MAENEFHALKAALAWHLDAGAEFPFADTPKGMMGLSDDRMIEERTSAPSLEQYGKRPDHPVIRSSDHPLPSAPLGASEARAESLRLARAANTLDDLRAAIAGFTGVGLEQTATNLVFADGLPGASLMVIGDAPGADEDRLGKPFAGPAGQLLDKILAAIGLSRAGDAPRDAAYLTNILNWRPPGNRTPTAAELDISLPFIERHIQLARPRLILLAGGVPAKALLGRDESISKLRGAWFDYRPRLADLADGGAAIPLIATYHPAYLLQTPAQKRLVWADMLKIMERLNHLDSANG